MDLRLRVLQASIVLGVLVAVFSEGLSVVRQLDTPGVAILWIVAAVCAVLLFRKHEVPAFDLRALYLQHRPVFAVVAAIALILGFLALWAAPNNYDSMTYRLPRIQHWLMQKSLAYYATHIPRQVYQAPFAEMCVMHLQLLTGGDRFANMVQYFAMIGSVVGLTHIVKLLGGSRRAQWLTALCTVTIPMGILQSTSTQNDYVLSFWLVCFVNFVLMSRERLDRNTALFAGGALGLCILTRQTAYIYALPFLLWMIAIAFRNLRSTWLPLALTAAVVIALNMGMYARNWEAFHNPLGTSQENRAYRYVNTRHDLPALISGVTRSIGIHIGAVPSRWWRSKVLGAVTWIHSAIGVDMNDPELTWPETEFAPAFTVHEDNAGNFTHFIHILGTLFAIFIAQKITGRDTRIYAICVVAAFVLFCWMVSWSPDRARMHLGFFVLLMPCLGIAKDKIPIPVIRVVLLSILVVQSLPFLFLNQTRPLSGAWSILSVDRTRQYFTNQPYMLIPYYRAAQFVQSRNCRQVGLILGGDDSEYPLWALTDFSVRFEHYAVRNYTSRYARPFTPCAIITRLNAPVDGYSVALRQDPVMVLVPTQ